jgi:hypothetical protein
VGRVRQSVRQTSRSPGARRQVRNLASKQHSWLHPIIVSDAVSKG